MNSNPEKFKLDRREVKIRQQFVATTRKTVEDISADMTSPATKGKIERDARDTLMATSRKTDRVTRMEKAKELENQDFIQQNAPMLVRISVTS